MTKKISLIIPTYNEEKNIGSLIDHLFSCTDSELLEIIVCDSPKSIDTGAEIAAAKGVKVVKASQAYRAFQLNYGASHATTSILYFLHADAIPPKNFIQHILNGLKTHDFGIFAYQFDSDKFMLKVNAFFTKFNGLFSGGGDQSLFIKRELFQELGGFDNGLRIMEDFNLYNRAKRSGAKGTIIKDPLIVSARKYCQNSWLKVNLLNLIIFLIYFSGGSQKCMIALNRKLK